MERNKKYYREYLKRNYMKTGHNLYKGSIAHLLYLLKKLDFKSQANSFFFLNMSCRDIHYCEYYAALLVIIFVITYIFSRFNNFNLNF